MAANCATACCNWLKNFWTETKNPERLPAKLHYFLYFASIGAIVPLLPLLASQLKASPDIIGYIYVSMQVVTVLFKPGFGHIADKRRRRKPLFLVCLIVSTMAYVSIYFIPEAKIVHVDPETLTCQNKTLFLRACSNRSAADALESTCNATCFSSESSPEFDDLCAHHFAPCRSQNSTGGGSSEITLSGIRLNFSESAEEECSIGLLDTLKNFPENDAAPSCVNATLDSCDVTCGDAATVVNDVTLISSRVAWLWVLMVIGNMFGGCVVSLGDAIVLGMIKDPEIYGKQRGFGSFGYAITVIVAMMLVRVFGGSEEKLNFSPAFYITMIIGFFSLMVAMRLKENVEDNVEVNQKPTCCGLLRLFSSWETGLHVVAVFSIGFFTGAMGAFFVIYLKELHAEQFLIGSVVAVQSFLGEIPFMFISSFFIKLMGHGYLMTTALAVFGIRLLCVSVIQEPWNVLLFEPSQGICFGLFMACMNTYSLKISPPGSLAAVQGIFQAIFEGLGIGIGGLIAGSLYNAYGSRSMWHILGLAGIVLATFHGLSLFLIRKYLQKPTTAPTPQEQAAAGGEDVAEEIEMGEMIAAPPAACGSNQ